MKRKLLIVDDEPGVRALVKMTLKSDLYDIIEASDGEEALRLAKQEKPRLVLLDVNMPSMTGFEVCRALKSDPDNSEMIVVMLTAQAQPADIRQGREAGVDDYFTKPFSPMALLLKVDEIFGMPEE